jgi:bifunctional non-homologous end joining protein LigD
VATRSGLSRAAATAAVEPLLFRTPTPPLLPGYIPLEAWVPCAEPFDDPDWLFSVDWDGARSLLFLDSGSGVRIQGEMLTDLAVRFPDVAGAVSAPEGRSAVLDGVIAVLDAEGRPDLAGLGQRLASGPAAAADLPAVYLAFDVLHLDGHPTFRWPLDRRLDALRGLAGSSDVLQVPDHVRGRGSALAEAAGARGLPALLARRASAPYRPGLASPDRLRIPLTDQATLAVVGVIERRGRIAELILGEQVAGHVSFAGQVDAPGDPRVIRWLATRAAALVDADAALDGMERAGTLWLRAGLTATVRHTGRTAGGALRRPSLLAVRDDVDPRWCVRRAPLHAPEAVASGSGFAPTLLVPLPLGDIAVLPRART